MRLAHLTYTRNGWGYESPLYLDSVNLLVGKNAVGKSKTILAIGSVINTLVGNRVSNVNLNVALTFEDTEGNFTYSFSYDAGQVVSESLVLESGDVLIERKLGRAFLGDEEINPPADKLVLHVRRDTKQYPYIEKIMGWAENSKGFSFNEVELSNDADADFNLFFLGGKMDLFTITESLGKELLAEIVMQACELGYPLTRIVPFELAPQLKYVLFYEEGVGHLLQESLSKGMYRALYLLIYMKYLSVVGSPAMLLVDDLCEGLDYDRSVKLGRMVFDFCLENNIQLIASSNDTILMDTIDLKYWNILRREDSRMSSINVKNNPKLFEDFLFTGLSNFDLLSSDFVESYLQSRNSDER